MKKKTEEAVELPSMQTAVEETIFVAELILSNPKVRGRGAFFLEGKKSIRGEDGYDKCCAVGMMSSVVDLDPAVCMRHADLGFVAGVNDAKATAEEAAVGLLSGIGIVVSL